MPTPNAANAIIREGKSKKGEKETRWDK